MSVADRPSTNSHTALDIDSYHSKMISFSELLGILRRRWIVVGLFFTAISALLFSWLLTFPVQYAAKVTFHSDHKLAADKGIQQLEAGLIEILRDPELVTKFAKTFIDALEPGASATAGMDTSLKAAQLIWTKTFGEKVEGVENFSRYLQTAMLDGLTKQVTNLNPKSFGFLINGTSHGQWQLLLRIPDLEAARGLAYAACIALNQVVDSFNQKVESRLEAIHKKELKKAHRDLEAEQLSFTRRKLRIEKDLVPKLSQLYLCKAEIEAAARTLKLSIPAGAETKQLNQPERMLIERLVETLANMNLHETSPVKRAWIAQEENLLLTLEQDIHLLFAELAAEHKAYSRAVNTIENKITADLQGMDADIRNESRLPEAQFVQEDNKVEADDASIQKRKFLTFRLSLAGIVGLCTAVFATFVVDAIANTWRRKVR